MAIKIYFLVTFQIYWDFNFVFLIKPIICKIYII